MELFSIFLLIALNNDELKKGLQSLAKSSKTSTVKGLFVETPRLPCVEGFVLKYSQGGSVKLK